MCKIVITFLSLAVVLISAQQFDLPMVVNFGSRLDYTPRVNYDVQALGPYVTPRNLTFRFEFETQEYNITGLRIRGTQPRYERFSINLERLQETSYALDVNVINCDFALFWVEAYGWERPVPDHNKN